MTKRNPELLILETDRTKIFGVDKYDRFIPIKGAWNFRDTGGYITKNGKSIKWKNVYRAGQLSKITEEDISYLKDLGIKTIIDLRTIRELETQPNVVMDNINDIHMPINDSDYCEDNCKTNKNLNEVMKNSYMYMIDKRAEKFGHVLKLFTSEENFPIVFHCMAGKDRTGITALLLYMIAGLDEDTIISDYTLSNYASSRILDYFETFGLDREEMYEYAIADEKWIIDVIDYINEKYNNVEEYLISKAGLTKEEVDSIYYNLIEQ